ncbi:hypothetical protein EGJ22_11295 [Pseudomonas sp. p99-361]|nr:hypothetical protein F1602_15675 [Pseudomonas putida]QKL04839.1 hypothetical protein GEV39_14965 [Pseudomonas sp. NY5710]RRV19221.1 hypothetical protein EGJ22_11295 [Pseudomonas sp. p99-361]
MDWDLWRPCVGIPGVCPPLCTYKDLTDGTYSLGWVKRANLAMDEMLYVRQLHDEIRRANP